LLRYKFLDVSYLPFVKIFDPQSGIITNNLNCQIFRSFTPEMSMAALPPPLPRRDRRGGTDAVAVVFGKNRRGSGAVAVAFFSRTLKNCVNLVEFQCLQMKHPETESI
jgi:hypothetical protein